MCAGAQCRQRVTNPQSASSMKPLVNAECVQGLHRRCASSCPWRRRSSCLAASIQVLAAVLSTRTSSLPQRPDPKLLRSLPQHVRVGLAPLTTANCCNAVGSSHQLAPDTAEASHC